MVAAASTPTVADYQATTHRPTMWSAIRRSTNQTGQMVKKMAVVAACSGWTLLALLFLPGCAVTSDKNASSVPSQFGILRHKRLNSMEFLFDPASPG